MIEAHQNQSMGKWLSFAMLTAALGMVSFVGLPSLAKLSPVKDRMELYEANQINGGATFYTDQPFLEKLLAEHEMKSDGKGMSTNNR